MGNVWGSKREPPSAHIPSSTWQDTRDGDAGLTAENSYLESPVDVQTSAPGIHGTEVPQSAAENSHLDPPVPILTTAPVIYGTEVFQSAGPDVGAIADFLHKSGDDLGSERYSSYRQGDDLGSERYSSYRQGDLGSEWYSSYLEGRVWQRLSHAFDYVGPVWQTLTGAFDYFGGNSHLESPVDVETSTPGIHGTEVLQSAGTYEVELNWEGEAELHNLKQHCQKNPDHDNFIPIDEFGPEHLPALYRNNLIIDLVKCLSILTVRLRVDKISLSRPKPPYPPKPRRNHLGRDCSINGTGHVTSTVVCSGETDTPCVCPECLESGNPVRSFAKIFIQTAAHVVYDDLEGANTTCYFNYVNDTEGLDTAAKVQGTKGIKTDVKEDRCWMFCYTHDLSLAKKLGVMSNNYQRLRREVSNKYCVNWSDTPEDKLTIIVSHPHGCSKYVTVGNIQGRLAAPDDDDWTQYSYTTPTCPGSSGAPIFMLGKHGYIDNHHHSGAPIFMLGKHGYIDNHHHSGAPIFMLGKHGYIDNHHHSGAVSHTGLNVSTFGLF